MLYAYQVSLTARSDPSDDCRFMSFLVMAESLESALVLAQEESASIIAKIRAKIPGFSERALRLMEIKERFLVLGPVAYPTTPEYIHCSERENQLDKFISTLAKEMDD